MHSIAMHIPDGFIDLPTGAAALLLSVLVLGYAVRRSGRELDDRTAPLAGLTAVFVFAAQMFNFPVAAGTSGHLLGGALAAILVGPWAGMLVLAVVVVVQALVFADGGISALGLNLLNLSIISCLVGWLVFRGLMRLLPPTRRAAAIAGGIAGFVTVPATALAFTAEYAIGGTAPVSLASLAAAMTGVHVLIGIGEGIITGLVLSAVLAARPDIVVGIRGLRTAPTTAAATEPVPA